MFVKKLLCQMKWSDEQKKDNALLTMFCQASPLESAGKRDVKGIKTDYFGKRAESSSAGRTILDFFL